MRLFACLIVAPQRGYDEPATLSYAISSFCPTSADGLQPGTKAIDGAFALNLLYASITVLSISVLRKKSIEARLLATCIWAQIALSTIVAAIRAINAVPMGAILAMVSQQLKSVRHFTIAPSLSPIAASLSPGFIVGETAASKNLRSGRIRVTYARSALRIFRNAPNFRCSAIAAFVRSPCRYCPFRLPGGPPLPLAPP